MHSCWQNGKRIQTVQSKGLRSAREGYICLKELTDYIASLFSLSLLGKVILKAFPVVKVARCQCGSVKMQHFCCKFAFTFCS